MLSQLAEKAAFVNYLPRLTQATVDDGDPTPAYLLDDITKITFQSTTLSNQLVDYLIHRLTKSTSTTVKIKVLKIIMYLVNNGHTSFRQQLRLHDDSIKNILHHSGPADPLLGLTLYKDAQKLAQDALDLLFNPEMMAEEEENAMVMESPYVFMAGMGASAHSTSKYEGFGNTSKDREGTVTDKMLDYLGRFIHPSDDQMSEAIRAALHCSPGDYQPVAVAGTLIDPVLSTDIPPTKTSFVKNHIPGRAGGGWESDEDEDNEIGSIQNVPRAKPKTASVLQVTSNILDLDADPLVDNTLKHAQHIVSKFIKIPGFPSIEELDEVCSICATVGYSHIFKALLTFSNELRNSPKDGQVLRILFLYEWLYHHDVSIQSAVDRDTVEILNSIVDLDLPTCKSKARKVKLLYDKVSRHLIDPNNPAVSTSDSN